MDLGQRIKQARLEAGLSQRQLCGEVITRNMLSLIENGSARPSMDTLRHFSQQLGKPLSWFLEESAVTSPNQAAMATARSCWAERNAEGVLLALEGYRAPDAVFDSERGLLEYLALLWLAGSAIDAGRLPYAQSLLHRAEACESPYLTDDSALQHLRAKAGLPANLICDDTLLLKAANEPPERCLALLQAVEDQTSAQFSLLLGKTLFALGRYGEALPHLERCEERCLAQLEVCCKELGDYKRAYEYACRQRD